MALAITWDRTDEQPRARYDAQAGWTIDRTGVLTGVTEVGANLLTKTVNDAIAAGVLPNLGDGHPHIANAFCYGYEPEATGNAATLKIRVLYRQQPTIVDVGGSQQPGQTPTLRFSATLGQVQASKDVHGALIEIPFFENGQWQTPSRPIITKMVPTLTIEVGTVVAGSPADLGRRFVGKVNQQGWLVAPNDPARTWMCTGLQAESRDCGTTYSVVWQFSYCPTSWDTEQTYMRDGEVPAGVTDGNGRKKFQIYEEDNFNLIGFI